MNKPRLLILDEATSALDMVTEERMYGLLKGMESVTYISVGHRRSLLCYHDMKLRIGGDEEGEVGLGEIRFEDMGTGTVRNL